VSSISQGLWVNLILIILKWYRKLTDLRWANLSRCIDSYDCCTHLCKQPQLARFAEFPLKYVRLLVLMPELPFPMRTVGLGSRWRKHLKAHEALQSIPWWYRMADIFKRRCMERQEKDNVAFLVSRSHLPCAMATPIDVRFPSLLVHQAGRPYYSNWSTVERMHGLDQGRANSSSWTDHTLRLSLSAAKHIWEQTEFSEAQWISIVDESKMHSFRSFLVKLCSVAQLGFRFGYRAWSYFQHN